MALFGGSKSTSSQTSAETAVNTVDNRVNDGDGSLGGNVNLSFSDVKLGGKSTLPGIGDVGGINTNISTTDFGALDAASELADKAFSFSNNAVTQLGAVSSNAVESASENAKTAIANVTRDEGARTTQIMVAAAGIVAVVLFVRSRK